MNRNSKTVVALVGVVLTMGALAWAAVPFYNWFCSVTGFGGTTQVSTQAPDEVLDEVVRVRFDANVDKNLDWTFRPMQTRMDVHIGQNAMAYFEAVNNSDQTITGTASYNVAPDVSGYYFDKIQCFCFTEQTLKPGERVEMPVSFFVDPELVNDRDASWVRDITLSYTFHRTEPKQAALDAAPADNVN
ncbi:cytochrome c oxidase assembly protein [Paracoccus sp. R12_1]|uniref:cytochrome c oxidase assembly protein n=1 Tax=unclassified Paracoccus (in: a-proteobacteria) TaxID=2688777 RepID=UPI000C0A2E3D|nr:MULTISPECIES: cytochrome c oxidase assembly protein [unclassified Paracoccus (in: a-proteobacteria)]MBO9454696.1 cytochrome c oxidase assembly protein [Paracoccus sp. R12_2]MBO9487326.1 cytochrome c oxidase assembly protein [Paracoccus sp. R12_1]PHQ71502.1 MAG: cytochrome c oxidase assembly protein [Paracoccus sp. (in: a-proteobacteria)]